MKTKDPILLSAGKFTSRGNWSHPCRCIDSSELIVVVDGNFTMREGEQTYCLSRDSVLLLEEGLEHSGVGSTNEPISFYWIHFRGLSGNLKGELKKHTVLKNSYAVYLLCRQLLFYSNGSYPPGVATHLLQVLLAEIGAQGREDGISPEALVVRIREWIRINVDRPLTVSQIALNFGYNEDYLSRLFKKNYGKSLKNVIDEMKTEQIKLLLLESNLTLYEISKRMNFEDYKLFLKFFKYHEGITPTEYRNLYCDIHTNNR